LILSSALLLLAPSPLATAPPSFDDALATVDSLRARGQFETALNHLDSLAQTHEERSSLCWRRALLLADLGKQTDGTDKKLRLFKRSLDASQNALEADSTDAWAHLTAALAEARLTLYVGTSERIRRSRAVKHHADRAIALDSTMAPAYHIRGRWHRDIADLGLLERTLVKTFYGGLPDASFEQSLRNFQRAIELESKPYNHLEIAKTYLAMDQPDRARRHLRKCLNTSGSPFDTEYHREARSLLQQL